MRAGMASGEARRVGGRSLPCGCCIGALHHTQNSRTSSAEMPRRLQSWRSMASKSAEGAPPRRAAGQMTQRPPTKRPREDALLEAERLGSSGSWSRTAASRGSSSAPVIMMSSHWCVPPSRSRKTLAEAALLLDTCSLLQPAQFFVRKRSSEKSEVLVTMSVLEAKSCGAETVPELVTSPQTTLPVDTPPLVAVKVQSRLSQSSGPAEAAPVMVSVAPVSAPVAARPF